MLNSRLADNPVSAQKTTTNRRGTANRVPNLEEIMNLDTFKKAGVHFDRCRFAVVPEIPYVQDVLYALRLSDKQKYYDFCRDNHATYIVNVGLVVAAVGYAVLCMERYDEAEARKIIAQAILDLTAPEDKCLFNGALGEATRIATVQPSKSASCVCANCREVITDRGDDDHWDECDPG